MSEERIEGESIANKSTFRSYIVFWIGQLFSIFGSSIVFFSVMWYLTQETAGWENQGTIVTTIMFIAMVPWTIILFFSGVFIDRWNRKRIIIYADSLQAIVTLVLIILFYFDLGNIWTTTVIFTIRQFLQGFHSPTVSAVIPLMIPREKLSRFNGLNTFMSSTLNIIGPLVAGVLYGFFNLEFNQILWIDVITFAIAIIPAIIIKIPSPPKSDTSEEKKSYISEFKIGFRTIMDIKGMAAFFLVTIVFNTLFQPFQSLNAIYFQTLGGGSFELALSGTFFQVAVLLGAGMIMLRKIWKKKALLLILMEYFIIFGMGLIVINTWFRISFYVVYSGYALFGFAVAVINAVYQTIFQETIPPDRLGRVFAVDQAISFFLMPLAALASGPLLDWLKFEKLYTIITVVLLVFITIVVIFSDFKYLGKVKLREGIEIKEGVNKESEFSD